MIAKNVTTPPSEAKNAIIELRIAILDANRMKRHPECRLIDQLTLGGIVSTCEAAIKALENLGG